MTALNPEEKRRHIFNHETKMARQLALMVLEKPEPPFWASFIPMVFVFYAQKLKQYSTGLDDFVDNYLSSRRHAIESATMLRNMNSEVDMDQLLERAGDMPPPARPLYADWMKQLISHYRRLLTSQGDSHAELVRAGYQSKTNYLLFCQGLNTAECALNMALLPGIEGDAQDILHIVQKMNAGIVELRRQDAEMSFP
jgi:hypothetical protein